MKQLAMVIDLDRCIGCGGCQAACKLEHDIALGPSRCKLYNIGPTGTYPDLEFYFITVTCQQCAEPVCAKVCPTGACYKSSEDGVVYIDRDVCIGCKSCSNACPYKAIIFNNELRVSDKCDLCPALRKAGEAPACVKNCSGAAISVGDVGDPQSEVSKLLAKAGERAYALPDSGVKPSGRFIVRGAKWQEPLPYMEKEGGGRIG